MKKALVFLTVLLLLSLSGCQKQASPSSSATAQQTDSSPETTPSVESTPAPQHCTDASNETAERTTIDTEYYTVTIPVSWNEDCFYEIADGENYNYTLSFYDKASHEAINSGWLFSICLLTEWEDYTVYPDYEVLGSLEVYRIGSYNIVVTYPTDVQYTEETAKRYRELSDGISDILNSVSYKDECVFSAKPIPVEVIAAPQEFLYIDFYTELCAYVVSSCVNDTEWWTDPTLSYTKPTHYYLGSITTENYDEKMEKAKQLVDSVYYWEIQYRGYGTVKIGLYITSDNELYFCYRY